MPDLPIDPYTQPGPLPEKPAQEVDIPKPSLDEKSLKSWWSKIEASETKRKEELDMAYDLAIKYYKSRQFPNDNSNNNAIVINYIASTFRLMLNAAYPNQPEYRITGKNPLGEQTKLIAEMGLNYYARETDIEDENMLTFIDSLLAGEGISLEAHSSQLVYATEPKKESAFPVPDPKENNNENVNKSPDELQYAEYIKRSIPVSFRISPKDFVRDITAKSFKKARWCGRRISQKPVEEVLDNSLYRKEALDKLRQAAGVEDGKTADLYELQIKRRINGDIELWRLVLCDQLKSDYLYYDKEVYEGEGFNYVIIQPNKLGDDIYAVSEFSQYKGPQDQLNQIHSKINEQISKSMMQPVINEDALTKKGKTAFLKGEGVITVRTGMNPANNAIAQVETSRVHPDLYKYEMITRDIFRVVSGIGETMRAGAQSTGSDTLGEAQMIQSGSNLALSGFRKSVRKFLFEQGRKKLQIIRQFTTEEQYIPIMGDIDDIPQELIDGKFLKFSSQFIKGDYELDIDLDTMRQTNEEVERVQYERMIKGLLLLEPGLTREGKRIKYYDLGQEWLRKFNKYNPSRYFEDLKLRSADEENLAMIAMSVTKNAQAFPAQEGENSDEHLKKHLEFAQSPLKSLIPPQVWMRVVEPHIADTLKRVEEKKQQMAKITGNKSNARM